MAGQMRSYGDLVNNLFNSGAQFAGTMLDQADDAIKRQAQIDMMAFDNQLTQDTNNFINNLSFEGDASKWQDEVNYFKESLPKLMNYDDASNPYYARNAYTARLMQSKLNDTMNRVQQMADEKYINQQHEKNRLTVQNSVESARNITDPQERLQNIHDKYQLAFENGDISLTQLEQAYDQEMQLAIADNVEAIYMDLLSKNPNMNPNDLIERAKRGGLSAVNGTNAAIRYSRLDSEQQDAAAKEGLKQAQTKVKQIQDGNNEVLYQQNTKILSDIHRGIGTPEQWEARIKQQIINIKKYNPSNLTPEQQRQREWELYSVLDSVKAASGGGRGSGSAQGAKSYSTLRSQMLDGSEAFVADLISKNNKGDQGGLYSAVNTYIHLHDSEAKDVKNYLLTQGYTEEEANRQYQDYILSLEKDIIDKAKKGGYLPVEFDSIMADFSKRKDKLFKKSDNPERDFKMFQDWAYDTLFGMDLDNVDSKEFEKRCNDFINLAISQNLDKVMAKDDGTYWKEGDVWKESNFRDALKQTGNDDLVWTSSGSTHWINESVEKNIWEGPLADISRQNLVDSLNAQLGVMHKGEIKYTDVSQHWELDSNGRDINPRLNFTVNHPDMKDKIFRLIEKDNKVVLEVKDRDMDWSDPKVRQINRKEVKAKGNSNKTSLQEKALAEYQKSVDNYEKVTIEELMEHKDEILRDYINESWAKMRDSTFYTDEEKRQFIEDARKEGVNIGERTPETSKAKTKKPLKTTVDISDLM